MFDVGFSELIVIAIVALVVIGPERLPKVARTAGLLLGRLQRYVNDVKSDISREMQLDELRKMQADLQESARHFEQSISSEVQSAEQALGEVKQSAQALVEDLSPIPPEVLHTPESVPNGEYGQLPEAAPATKLPAVELPAASAPPDGKTDSTGATTTVVHKP